MKSVATKQGWTIEGMIKRIEDGDPRIFLCEDTGMSGSMTYDAVFIDLDDEDVRLDLSFDISAKWYVDEDRDEYGRTYRRAYQEVDDIKLGWIATHLERRRPANYDDMGKVAQVLADLWQRIVDAYIDSLVE